MLTRLMSLYGRLPARWQNRLRRWLVGPAKRALSGGVLVQDGFVLARRLDQSIPLHLLRFGAYEPGLSAVLRQTLTPGDTFIDVGANVGYFTLLGAACVGPAGQVHSFEPNPATFKALQHNLRLNRFTHVQANPTALTDQAGPIPLWFGPGIDSGLASLRRTHALLTHTVTAQAQTLDDYVAARQLGRVRAMKLDVEGAEALVLAGARHFLAGPARPDLIALEFNRAHLAAFDLAPDTSLRLLRECGYHLAELIENPDQPGSRRALPAGALPSDGTVIATRAGEA